MDELIEKLILIEKIERGNDQSNNDDILSESELDEEMNRWFK